MINKRLRGSGHISGQAPLVVENYWLIGHPPMTRRVSKKSFVHGRTYAAIAWMRRCSELAAHGEIKAKKNDDINYWILAFASMTIKILNQSFLNSVSYQ